jgi:ribosomal protein S18 acetylase RimI-like enzyme
VSLADEVVFRRATDGDAGELLTLQRATYVIEAQAYGNVELPPLTETLEEIRAAIADHLVLVGRLGPRAVSAGRVRVADRVGHIGRLAVAPDLQSHGIGRRLLGVLEAAVVGEVDAFELFTGERSERNLALYRSCGYRDARLVPITEDYGLVHLRKEVAGAGMPAPAASWREAVPLSVADLVGSWDLRSWEAIGDDGSVGHPMGERVEGILVYTASGTMITTIGPAQRPRLASADPLRGGDDTERRRTAETFIAYAGSFRVEGEDVLHAVTLSLYPNWVGTLQRRHAALPDERTLVLSTDPFAIGGGRSVQRLTWDRRTVIDRPALPA